MNRKRNISLEENLQEDLEHNVKNNKKPFYFELIEVQKWVNFILFL
jgi:hypothetical protein